MFNESDKLYTIRGNVMQKNMIKSLICFVPTIWGLLIWNYLPDSLAVHFGMFGVDRYESKLIVIFIIPFMFYILNMIYLYITIKYPDWLTPTFKSIYLKKYLFPLLSLIVFLVSISNSI